ncbi:hypothetical protein IKF89_00150 [Candidatus Saccharibacteria bacterium]|nr:hypothetical protein [Candidatus Saccharibacteria bacterium]
MGKRLPLLIPTLAVAITGVSIYQSLPASAMTTTDTGRQAWSIDEMNELFHQFQAEKDNICGNDSDCRRNLDYERAESDPKYNALHAFSMSSLSLSAINPAENTFRLYYRDIDNMAMEMEGIERHSPLTEAYAVWLDSDFTDRDNKAITHMQNDVHLAGMHEIYKATTALNGANWFPVETEVEIFVPDAHLELNDRGLIMLFGASESSSSLGWMHYDDCINSANYQPGMECRLMYTEDNYHVYLPFWPENRTLVTTDSANTDPNPASETSNIENESATVAGNNNNAIPTAVSTDVSANPVATPNTGEATMDKTGSFEFPWWLGAIFIIGPTILVWFFRPNPKKSTKNRKKILTTPAAFDKMVSV